MIVPRNRLLLWFAVVALPFSILGALHPAALAISAGLIVVLLIVIAADALFCLGAFSHLQLETPPIVRLSQGRETKIELRIHNVKTRLQTLQLALCLPAEIETSHEQLSVKLDQSNEWSTIPWPCRPLKRGHYRLESINVQRQSPLGFWDVRGRRPLATELRVYPDLLSERKNLGMYFLRRNALGMHTQRQVGKGRDFEKLREYVPGDGYEDIHWKATAKKGHPVTKVYQIERTQEIYVVIDSSRLSARGNLLERFITSALVVGLTAEQQGDLFGLVAFSDKVEAFVRARNGKAHYDACRDAIYALQPRQANPDYDEVCSFIRLRLRKRALLIFLTSLDDPVLAETFVRNIQLVSGQHLVLVNMAQPQGAVPLFTHGSASDTDDLYEHLGGHLRWQDLQELGKMLERRGVGFSMFEKEQMTTEIVSQYLEVKKRQLL